MDSDITEDNLDKLKRMEKYLLMAIENGDTAWLDNGKVIISFYRRKTVRNTGSKDGTDV